MLSIFSSPTLALSAVALFGGAALLAWRRQRWRETHSFRKQVVLITGGSRGLGLELARRWADEGASIAICARNQTELEAASDDIRQRGTEIQVGRCDVTQPDQIAAFVRQVLNRWGRIDVLVNNAGIIQAGPLECMTVDDFQRTMDTHFWAALHFILACLPSLRDGGRIVNIASVGGEISVPHLTPYSASKFALVGLSRGITSELAAQGIRVLTVCPGLMRTGEPAQRRV